MRGVSPNIIIDCDRDTIATFHYFNSQDKYSYETVEDDGHHFFYPHLFKSRLFDQSFNGGPIIVFEPEVKFFHDYIPIKGGDMFIRGNFLFDFEKKIKPLEIYYGDISSYRMINDTIVTPKYYGKDIYSIYINPGCNAFIKVIDPNSNKILAETNYINDDNSKCESSFKDYTKSYNHNQNHYNNINNQHINNNTNNQNNNHNNINNNNNHNINNSNHNNNINNNNHSINNHNNNNNNHNNNNNINKYNINNNKNNKNNNNTNNKNNNHNNNNHNNIKNKNINNNINNHNNNNNKNKNNINNNHNNHNYNKKKVI